MMNRLARVRRGLLLILPASAWLAGGASAMPLISEIYYDAPGSDDGQSFVELSGSPGASLEGYTLEGINGSNGASGPTIVLHGFFGMDGLFVVGDRTSAGTTSVVDADLLSNFDFQNGPDSVVLRAGETRIDAVGYGLFAPDEFFAGEGAPAPDGASGESLTRIFANLDSDDNATDFRVSTVPTPGEASFLPVPQPGPALLMALGLLGLGAVGGNAGTVQLRQSG